MGLPSPLLQGVSQTQLCERNEPTPALSIFTVIAGKNNLDCPPVTPKEGYGRRRGRRCRVADSDSDKYRSELAAYERETAELHEQGKALEEEVVTLRRRLQDAPKRVRTLEEKLLETKGQLQQAISQNEKLTYTLREAREHIAALREEVDKLTQPPSAYGTFLGTNDDGTVDVFSAGRKMRVALHPELALEEGSELRRGAEVVLNESLNVVLARSAEQSGEVVTLKEVLDDLRAI